MSTIVRRSCQMGSEGSENEASHVGWKGILGRMGCLWGTTGDPHAIMYLSF